MTPKADSIEITTLLTTANLGQLTLLIFNMWYICDHTYADVHFTALSSATEFFYPVPGTLNTNGTGCPSPSRILSWCIVATTDRENMILPLPPSATYIFPLGSRPKQFRPQKS